MYAERSPFASYRLYCFSAAVLVFFAAAAGARIVSADLLRLYYGLGLSVSLCDLGALLFGEDVVPFRKAVEVVGMSILHVEIELFEIDVQLEFAVRFHVLEIYRLVEAVVDAVEKADKDAFFYAELSGFFAYFSGIDIALMGEDISVDACFRAGIFVPELIEGLFGLILIEIDPILIK